MDQITFESWIEDMSAQGLMSRQVLGMALEINYGDARKRRVDALMKRADKVGLDRQAVQQALYDMEDALADAEDPDQMLAQLQKNTMVSVSLGAIRGAHYGQDRWVVKDLLPQGLAILAAPPKAKKSWMALDLCLAVAEGKPFLDFPTRKSRVYYLALEDSARRLKERTDILLGSAPSPDNIRFSRESPSIREGLSEGLNRYMTEYPDTGLIIVDTLQKVRGVRKSQDVYGSDYADLTVLKRIADQYGICVLVIHHTTKDTDSPDPFNLINGSNGIAGTADTELVLIKQRRSDSQTTLHITGRDVLERDLALEFSEKTCRWKNLGRKQDLEETARWTELESDPVYAAAVSLGKDGWKGTTSQFRDAGIALGFDLQDVNLRALSLALWKLKEVLRSHGGVTLTKALTAARHTTFCLSCENGKSPKTAI